MLDRTYPLFPFRLNLEQTHRFRDVYLLTASDNKDSEHTDPVIRGIEWWIQLFNGTWTKCPKGSTKLAGVIRGLGVDRAGEIRNQQDIMKEAYEMGKAV